MRKFETVYMLEQGQFDDLITALLKEDIHVLKGVHRRYIHDQSVTPICSLGYFEPYSCGDTLLHVYEKVRKRGNETVDNRLNGFLQRYFQRENAQAAAVPTTAE